LNEILLKIQAIRERQEKLIVAIDGFGGAGKSSLARSLESALGEAKHIEFDWYHFPRDQIRNDCRFDFQRFKHEVVEPFKANTARIQIGKYNWGYLAEKPEEIKPDSIGLAGVSCLLVEGVMTLSKELSDLTDLKIWVGIDVEECRKRGINRDIHKYGLKEKIVIPAWKEWADMEDRCLLIDDRRKRADIVISDISQ
jgi:uridine kinase